MSRHFYGLCSFLLKGYSFQHFLFLAIWWQTMTLHNFFCFLKLCLGARYIYIQKRIARVINRVWKCAYVTCTGWGHFVPQHRVCLIKIFDMKINTQKRNNEKRRWGKLKRNSSVISCNIIDADNPNLLPAIWPPHIKAIPFILNVIKW